MRARAFLIFVHFTDVLVLSTAQREMTCFAVAWTT